MVLPEGGGQVSNLAFGTLYFGHDRSFTTLLVNNGPYPASFNMVLTEDAQEEESDEDDEAKEVSKTDKPAAPFVASPADGIIQPYTITCHLDILSKEKETNGLGTNNT